MSAHSEDQGRSAGEPWHIDWDSCCTRCSVHMNWEGDPPEGEDDALCNDCVWREVEEGRAEVEKLRAALEPFASMRPKDMPTNWATALLPIDRADLDRARETLAKSHTSQRRLATPSSSCDVAAQPNLRNLAASDDRRFAALRRNGCLGPIEHDMVPVGGVGLDMRAPCPKCGKRVRVTARGRYSHHKAAKVDAGSRDLVAHGLRDRRAEKEGGR